MDLLGPLRQPAHAGQPLGEFLLAVRVPEPVLLAPGPQAVLRPWNRTTDSRGEVTAVTGGTEEGSVCVMSTATAAMPYPASSALVSSARSGSHHAGCRNSTETGHPRVRSAHSRRYASARSPGRNQGGNWNSTLPSRPARRSGSIPAANRAHTSSSTSGSR